MAKLTELNVDIRAVLDENGAIVSLSGLAPFTHSDDTDPAYHKSGEVDITSTLTPGSTTLSAWKNAILALVNAEA